MRLENKTRILSGYKDHEGRVGSLTSKDLASWGIRKNSGKGIIRGHQEWPGWGTGQFLLQGAWKRNHGGILPCCLSENTPKRLCGASQGQQLLPPASLSAKDLMSNKRHQEDASSQFLPLKSYPAAIHDLHKRTSRRLPLLRSKEIHEINGS